ncbi:amidohydrolase family protein [Halobellus captivus]|uniref:amidohydrolase family protein n=1 Tax=Halobellus captivus TaxID=2592614 RepID=UPI0013969F65|nr:amidohydrolase family protein [Halobellus captivus]
MSVKKFQPADRPEIPEAVREAFIVDIDVHLSIKMLDDLFPYMDDRIVDKLDRPWGKYQFEAIDWLPTWANDAGGIGVDSHGTAKTGEDILAMMESMGTDVPIVTPGFQSLPQVAYPRMKEEVCRAYNDYVLEHVTSAHDNIHAQILLPLWDPEQAVAELDRVGSEPDFAAAYGWFGKFWRLGNPEYDQLYDKLTELDLPLSLHLDVASYADKATPEGDAIRTWIEAIGFDPATHAIMNTVNMIVTGVFDKYPDLNVVYQEGGVHWLPFVAYRMDEFYQHTPEDVQLAERMYDQNKKYLDKLPSEYLWENVKFSTQPVCLPDNPKHYEWLLEMEHAENTLMFATDWPHSTNDPPTWIFEHPHIDEPMRERILHETAEEVYRL